MQNVALLVRRPPSNQSPTTSHQSPITSRPGSQRSRRSQRFSGSGKRFRPHQHPKIFLCFWGKQYCLVQNRCLAIRIPDGNTENSYGSPELEQPGNRSSIGSNQVTLAAPPPFIDPRSAIFKDQYRFIASDIFDSNQADRAFLFGQYGKLPTYKVLPLRSISGESCFIHYEMLVLGFDKAGTDSGKRKILTTANRNRLRQWLVSAPTQEQYRRG